jgi:predicted alpha/beta hydrolase family esterase
MNEEQLTPSHAHHFPNHIQSKLTEIRYLRMTNPQSPQGKGCKFGLGAYKTFKDSVVLEISKVAHSVKN